MKAPQSPRKSSTPSKKAEKDPVVIEIDYKQAADLKTSMVSGALSTVTLEGVIQLVFYIERRTFPVKTQLTINPKDGSSEEEDTFEKDAVVREINHSLLMDVPTAEFIVSTLQHSLERIAKRESKSKAE